jgi:hypothetical protein
MANAIFFPAARVLQTRGHATTPNTDTISPVFIISQLLSSLSFSKPQIDKKKTDPIPK